MGVATQIVGMVILVSDFIFGERIVWGIVGNVIFIGTFIDLINSYHWVPIAYNLAVSFGMLLGGLAVVVLATFTYHSAQLGAGSRDGYMIAMTKRINLSVGWIRNMIEVVVLIASYFIGGSVELGTLIMSILFGRFIQLVFKIFKYDVMVKHCYIDEDLLALCNFLKIGSIGSHTT